MMIRTTLLGSLLMACMASPNLSAQTAQAPQSPHPRNQTLEDSHIVRTDSAPATPVVLATGLDHPWGMAFLEDGRLLVSERSGQLRVLSPGNGQWRVSAAVAGVPEVSAMGQGGLLDVAVWKERVFFSYSEPGELLSNGTAVMSAQLAGDDAQGYRLENTQVIFRQQPKKISTAHFGSRLLFTPDGYLFVTLGERFLARDSAQTLDNHLGKVVRIFPDGSVPTDNPFVKTAGANPEIWSYGHRNPQGAALNPATGQLWIHEHGPKGGDEINIPYAGANYGWPLATWGKEYTGGDIGDGPIRTGTESPLYYWLPSIAPSGMLFYTGHAYPGWDNSLLVGSLKFQQLVRLTLNGETVTAEERLFGTTIQERIRDLEQGPDGLIYLLTDNRDGKLIVLKPAP